MTSQQLSITAEQFRVALELLAVRREAKKQAKQQAADKATLELARERIKNHQGESA